MAWEDIKPSNIKRLWNPSVSGICHVGAWRAAEIHEYKENFCGVSGIVGDFPVTFIEADKSIEEHIVNSIAEYDDVDYKMVAAGSSFADAVFYAATNEQSSSLLKPKEHLRAHPRVKFHDPVDIKIEPLDHIMRGKSFNFLIMDVQGYELEVLKGAAELLADIDYIHAEINRAELYEGCVMVSDLDMFLQDFVRVNTEWWPGQDWGDAFYIRRNLLSDALQMRWLLQRINKNELCK